MMTMNVDNDSHHHRRGHGHHSFLRSLSLQNLMHHEKDLKAAMMPPKGWVVVKVGRDVNDVEAAMERFEVPVSYLNHPSFAQLLEEAEKEYGFRQQGVIVIPCDVERFRKVKDDIEREMGGATTGNHHHHHHHHHEHHHHFAAACFGRDG